MEALATLFDAITSIATVLGAWLVMRVCLTTKETPFNHPTNFDKLTVTFFFIARYGLTLIPMTTMNAQHATPLGHFVSAIATIALTTYNFQQWMQFMRYERARKAVGLA